MKQYRKVADLLWDRVRDDCQRRRYTQLVVRDEAGSDRDAVAKIVDRIADHDHEPRSTHERVGVVMMRRYARAGFVERRVVGVAPQDELLQEEEGEHPGEHGGHDALDAAVRERLGQQVEKHGPEQRADRETHQPLNPPPAGGEGPGGEQQRQCTAGKASENDRRERRHGKSAERPDDR